jgi:hypothetical protein
MKSYTLSSQTKSGTYGHLVRFRPLEDGRVEVRQTMWDTLLGHWMDGGNSTRILPVEEARELYREKKSLGYKVA